MDYWNVILQSYCINVKLRTGGYLGEKWEGTRPTSPELAQPPGWATQTPAGGREMGDTHKLELSCWPSPGLGFLVSTSCKEHKSIQNGCNWKLLCNSQSPGQISHSLMHSIITEYKKVQEQNGYHVTWLFVVPYSTLMKLAFLFFTSGTL